MYKTYSFSNWWWFIRPKSFSQRRNCFYSSSMNDGEFIKNWFNLRIFGFCFVYMAICSPSDFGSFEIEQLFNLLPLFIHCHLEIIIHDGEGSSKGKNLSQRNYWHLLSHVSVPHFCLKCMVGLRFFGTKFLP